MSADDTATDGTAQVVSGVASADSTAGAESIAGIRPKTWLRRLIQRPRDATTRLRRYSKRAVIVIVVLLIPVTYSYVGALTGPGTDSLQTRTVEWARDHHLGSVVDRVEKYWYARHQAKVGGTPSTKAEQLGIAGQTTQTSTSATTMPSVSVTTSRSTPVSAPAGSDVGDVTSTLSTTTLPTETTTTLAATAVRPVPAPLVSPVATPLPNEGQWTGFGPLVDGHFGAYGTLIRPDTKHTSVLDAIVWIDPALLSLRQYPGAKVPGRPWDRPDHVETDRQSSLVAAFSGGFRLSESHGGLWLGGKELVGLRDGAASLVIDTAGQPQIGIWGRDFTTTDGLDSVRQNLALIVDNGVVSPQLATDQNLVWGFTGPDNRDAVWRSGAGVTADGAIVWVGGDGLSIVTLAETLVRAGAVRGMQLEINREWVQFNTYATDGSGEVHGRKLLAAMEHSDDRYLSEDTRDFIAVFARPAAVAANG